MDPDLHCTYIYIMYTIMKIVHCIPTDWLSAYLCKVDVIMFKTTSLCVVMLLILLSARQTVQHECYVKPENSTVPCPSPCHILQDYVDNKVEGCKFGTTNITYIFLDGVHKLFENVSLNFFKSDSISLVGNSTENSQPEIVCHNQAGFFFKNSTNIVIRSLTFTGCGHWYHYMVLGGQATLAFNNVTNVTVADTRVRNSTGYGLYALCALGCVEVFDSVFAFNEGAPDYDGGNAGFLYNKCIEIDTSSDLSIRSSYFLHGFSNHINPLATGLSIFVWSSGVNVEIDNITAIGNVAANSSTGGNVAILLRNRTNIISNSVLVKNSYIADGHGWEGAGMYLSILDTPPYDTANTTNHFSTTTNKSIPEVITIVNTQFIGNHAQFEGGGLYLITHEEAGIFSPIGNVTVRDCIFHNNTLNNSIGGGVAVHLLSHYVLSYVNHSVHQFYVSLVNCTIQGNMLLVDESLDNVYTGSGAVRITMNPSGILLENCRILNNNCTGITTVWSTVIFAGNVTIAHNEGTNGGGIILCDNSYMLLKAHTTVVLQENKARYAGGGIYAEDSCLQSEQPCFFQLDIEIYKEPSLNDTVHVHLVNNTAEYAGSAIYGGYVGFCFLFPQFLPDLNKHGAEMFKSLFNITHPPSDLSPISSNPYQVCFCTQNYTWPECSKRSIEKTVYPGEQLSLHALTVGQFNGRAPHTIIASLLNTVSGLRPLEYSQNSNYKNACTNFQYHVYSRLPSEVIVLSVQHLGFSFPTTERGKARVYVTLRQCPIGFTITDSQYGYVCDCVETLSVQGITCNITNKTIHRNSHSWIGICQYQNSSDCHLTDNKNNNGSDYGIVFHNYCPYDFCIESDVYISTGSNRSCFDGDIQCAYHRTGVLCGACKDGYSMILGNSECRHCSNTNLLLLLVFIAAGLLLVLLLILTDLSVSSGALSALIFYANIVQVNRAIFFGASISSPAVYLCSIFIAWLNLDFGIKVCFYDGLDAYTKTWLQFAFPLYVWGIAGVIILLSRRFPSIAGRNPVRVLATLFLLSYAKLLRTIITALSPVKLEVPMADGNTTTRLVWREDGNVDYLQGKHIPLFIVALSFGLVTLPYAVVLFLVQWLQKHNRVCSWVVKMKPLFDAYTGPYKTNYRFWTGLLLLFRILLFVTFTSPSADMDSKLSLIIATCVIVQTLAWSFRGVYENIYTEILNSVFLLNLGLFASATSYTSHCHGNQNIAIYLSIGVTWILFCFTLIYSTFLQIQATKKWHQLRVWFTRKQYIWCPRSIKIRRKNMDSNDGEDRNGGVTYSCVDPFDFEYREPLVGSVSSESSSYGT